MAWAGIIPLFFIGGIYVRRSRTTGKPEAFLDALLVWACVSLALTEILSAFGGLDQGLVSGIWFLLSGTSAVIALVSGRISGGCGLGLTRFFREQPLAAGLLAGMAGITFILGTLTPPNFFDSLTYHMPRVMHWIQNGSVRHYQTDEIRQLYNPPLSEFLVLQFQCLAGGDTWAHMVSWLSMLGSWAGVGLIASKLGAGKRGTGAALIFAATIPLGITDALDVQTNYSVTLWIVCFYYFGLCGMEKLGNGCLIRQGTALGLAFLTKYTAVFFTAPFLILQGCYFIYRRPRDLARWGMALAALVLIINAPHWARNHKVFGHPWVPQQEWARESGERTDVKRMVSTALKNVTLHLGTSEAVNRYLEKQILKAHALWGLDIEDPAISKEEAPFRMHPFNTLEDLSGNTLHFLLILLTFVLIWNLKAVRENPRCLFYALALIAAFLLFCFLLRWSYSRQRLHLPLFVLSAPLVGILLNARTSGKFISSLMIVLFVSSAPWWLMNARRPVFPNSGKVPYSVFVQDRFDQYDAGHPWISMSEYRGAVKALGEAKCRTVGLVGSFAEYLFWAAVKKEGAEFKVVKPLGQWAAAYPETREADGWVYLLEHKKEAKQRKDLKVIFESKHLLAAIPVLPAGIRESRTQET